MSKSNLTALHTRIQETKLLLARAKAYQLTQDDKAVLQKFISKHPKLNPANDYETASLLLERLKKELVQEKNDIVGSGEMYGLFGDASAAPNLILRSGLFPPTKRGKRAGFDHQMVGKDGDISLFWSGLQLDQGDQDVLLGLTRVLSDMTEHGNVEKITNNETGRVEYSRVRFTRHHFLKFINRSSGKSDYIWLDKSIARLGGRLTLAGSEGSISGSLVGNFYINDESGELVVDLNHLYINQFTNDQFALLSLDTRHQLKGVFTKWLYGFVMTHSGTTWRDAETLIDLSGSASKNIKDFMSKQATPAFKQLLDLKVISTLDRKGHMYTWTRNKSSR